MLFRSSQCSVNAAGASVVLSGNQLTLNLPLSFQAAFGGAKSVYAYAGDTAGLNSGWHPLGTWTVSEAPSVVSVTPSSGTGSSQTFAITVSDPGGAAAINTVYVLVNNGFTAISGCYLLLQPGSTNSLSLWSNQATAFQVSTVGSGGALSNSQCSVNAAGASVVLSGNQLTLNLPLSFQAAFGGAKSVYAYASDTAGLNSGWQPVGTWIVP